MASLHRSDALLSAGMSKPRQRLVLLARLLVLGAAAGALWRLYVTPHVVGGYGHVHSYYVNVPWMAAFVDQVGAGDLYPRWLVEYVHGFGAPVFYYYAPLPFYLGAAVATLCSACSLQDILAGVHWSIAALSGVAFWAWARRLASPFTALAGALLYVGLPYHYLDLEIRGSLGEALAYAAMPLALWAAEGLARSARAVAYTALAYAGLILCHLPAALLFTPVLALFALAPAGRADAGQTLFRLTAAGLLGVGLAALYLLPALTLRDMVIADGWLEADGVYLPEKWLLRATTLTLPDGVLGMVVVALGVASAVALLALGLPALAGRRPGHDTRAGPPLMAAVGGLVLAWLMMSGLSEWLWLHLWPLRQVQFPWRFGVVVDLCTAVVVVLVAARLAAGTGPRRWLGEVVAGTAVLGVAGATLVFSQHYGQLTRVETHDRPVAEEIALMAGVGPGSPSYNVIPTEYRTKGMIESTAYQAGSEAKHPFFRNIERFEHWRGKAQRLPESALSSDDAGTVDVTRTAKLRFHIEATLERPATVRLRRLHAPVWQMHDSLGERVALYPDPEYGLIAFDLDAGAHSLTLTLQQLPEERIGLWISLTALVLTGVLLIRLRP